MSVFDVCTMIKIMSHIGKKNNTMQAPGYFFKTTRTMLFNVMTSCFDHISNCVFKFFLIDIAQRQSKKKQTSIIKKKIKISNNMIP